LKQVSETETTLKNIQEEIRMTIKLEKQGIADKILKIFGKTRRYEPVGEVYEKYGHHSYVQPRREGFWKALFRKNG